jgi:hypothetical protein
MRRCQRGQALVEATLVMIVFFALLLGVLDVGQVLFAHQALVERARYAARWGSLHEWAGPGPIVNLVLYGEPAAPRMTTEGFLGLKPDNVVVRRRTPTPQRPDDETLTVEIVNFETHLFAPWMARALVSSRPVSATAPMSPRTTRMADR